MIDFAGRKEFAGDIQWNSVKPSDNQIIRDCQKLEKNDDTEDNETKTVDKAVYAPI